MRKLLIASLILILASCASSHTGVKKSVLYEVLSQESNGGASIRFFEILSESNEILMLQNDKKLKGRVKSTDTQTANFVLLNMGEKPTGGYKIEVASVVETEKNIIITTKDIVPLPNSNVTESITTPYTVLKINSKKEILFQ